MNHRNSHQTLKQISLSLGFLGLLVGFLVGYGVLSGDALGRVNLLFLLMLFAFLPVLGLILSLVLIAGGGGKGLAGWILELPILPQRLAVEMLNLGVSASRKPWLFYQTQVLTLSFAVGGLLVYFFLLLGSDISFVWRSTVLQATDLLPVLNGLAVPWWFWPEAQPSLELLQQTQDFRLSTQTTDAPVLGQWWKYILAAQCTYNLLPRTLMLLIAKHRYKRATSTTSTSQGLSQRDRNPINLSGDRPVLAAVVHSITSPYVLLDWANSLDFCHRYISNLIGTPVEIYHIKPLSSPSEIAIEAPIQSLLVLVKSWEPPMGELSDYLFPLSGSPQKFILPLDWDQGKVRPITTNHLGEWRRFCGALSGWQLLQLDESP